MTHSMKLGINGTGNYQMLMPFMNLLKQALDWTGTLNYTPGTNSGLVVSSAGNSIGDTVISIASSVGSGVINSGDIIQFTGSAANGATSDLYLVSIGSSAPKGGTITLSSLTSLRSSLTPYVNAGSGIGISAVTNISAINYGDVDANGYLQTMRSNSNLGSKSFTAAGVTATVLSGITASATATYPYPAGNYVFIHDGSAQTWTFGNDVSARTSAGLGSYPERYILTVNTPSAGIKFTLTTTNATPANNYRLIYCTEATSALQAGVGANEVLYNNGQNINPYYLAKFKNNIGIYRTMELQNIKNSIESAWSDRCIPSWITWYNGSGSNNPIQSGIPIEVCVAFANELNCDLWINTPYLADDTFMSNMATVVKSGTTDAYGRVFPGLSSAHNVVLELANELWNQLGGFNLQHKARTQITSVLPNNPGNYPTPYWVYGGLRTVQMRTIWKSTWTGADASRLSVSMGIQGFAANTGRTNNILGTDGSTVRYSTTLGTPTGLGSTTWGYSGSGPYTSTGLSGTVASNVDAVHGGFYYVGPGSSPGTYYRYLPMAWWNTSSLQARLFGSLNSGNQFPANTGTMSLTGSTYTFNPGWANPPDDGSMIRVTAGSNSLGGDRASFDGNASIPLYYSYNTPITTAAGGNGLTSGSDYYLTYNASAGGVEILPQANCREWTSAEIANYAGGVPGMGQYFLEQDKAIIANWNPSLPYYIYETGTYFQGRTSTEQGFAANVRQSTAYEDYYTNVYSALESGLSSLHGGVAIACHYADIFTNSSATGGSFFWGTLQNVQNGTEPVYQTIVDWNLSTASSGSSGITVVGAHGSAHSRSLRGF